MIHLNEKAHPTIRVQLHVTPTIALCTHLCARMSMCVCMWSECLLHGVEIAFRNMAAWREDIRK